MTHRVLITAFGPFPHTPDNPTPRLAQRVAARIGDPADPALVGWQIDTRTLSTSWDAPAELVGELRDDERLPDVIVALGVSHLARGLRVERWAVNEAALKTPDVTGKLPEGKELVPGAPERLEGLMHRPRFERVVRDARVAGHPVDFSDDAGRYLCNALFFHLLQVAEASGETQLAGFVHVPHVSGVTADARGGTELPEDVLVEGLVALVLGWCALVEEGEGSGEGQG